MTDFLTDNFESGSINAAIWVARGSGGIISNLHPAHGTYGVRFITPTGAPTDYRLESVPSILGTTRTSVYARGYFYILQGMSALVDVGDRFNLISFLNSAGLFVSIGVTKTSSGIQYHLVGKAWDSVNNVLTYPSVVVPTATATPTNLIQICVELHAVVSSTAGEYVAYVNGVEVARISGVNNTQEVANAPNACTYIKSAAFGIYSREDTANNNLPAIEVFGDDFKIADTYIGPITTVNHWHLTASAGAGGTVSPVGSIDVPEGQSQSVIATPNTGYRLKDWIWDTVAQNSTTNPRVVPAQTIDSTHTLQAVFESTGGGIPLWVILVGAGGIALVGIAAFALRRK